MVTGRPQLAELRVLERRAGKKVIYTFVHTLRPLLGLLREAALTSSRHNLASGLDSQAQEDTALCQRLFLEWSQLC